MSPMNVDVTSGFFSIELVTSAIVPSAGYGDRPGSFDRYLQQAVAATSPTSPTDRPPRPQSQPQARDDAAGPIDRQSPQRDRAEATEPTPESDRQTGPDEPSSETDNGPRAPDADAAPEEDNEPDEAQDEAQPTTDSPPPVAALDVEALIEAGDLTSSPDASSAEGVVDESQSETTPQQPTSPGSGELPPGGPRQPGPLEAETEPADKSSPPPDDQVVQTGPPQQEETVEDTGVWPADGSSGAGRNHGDAASPVPEAASPAPEAAGLGTAVASSQAEASQAESRRQDGDNRGGDRRGDGPIAEQGPIPESGQAEQLPSMALPADAPTQVESDGGTDPTTGSTSLEPGGVEVAPSTRAWSEPGTQPDQAPRVAEPAGADQAGRVRFVQRVAQAFETMGDRGGSLRLRLHPPELGSLRLEVTVRNGTMTARLEVESESARTMLLDNLPALRDRLAQQDIKVDRFDVDVDGRSSSDTPQGAGDQSQPHDRPDLGAPDPGSQQETEVEPRPQPRAGGPPDPQNQLDVVV